MTKEANGPPNETKAAVEGEVAVATPLGAIVTEPAVPRSVMTSQSTASFKVPKRKFKAKPGRAPLKRRRPEVFLDACLMSVRNLSH